MITAEYKLDYVVARLIERLEGTRRTFKPDGLDDLQKHFTQIARDYVSTAMNEFREVGLSEQADLHVAFIEREVMQTFLPRYVRLANDANRNESSQYGLRWFGGLAGRLALGGISLASLVLMPRLRLQGMFYPALPVLLMLPFLPDITRWFYERRHRNALQQIVNDMSVIQESQTDYEPRLYQVEDESDTTRAKSIESHQEKV